MGATNHTPNYNLPQFIGTDKPTWLGDVNGAFSDIDTQMKANATSAAQGISDASAANSVATSANNKATTLDTQINTPSTGLAAVVSTHTTAISNLQTLAGSNPLTTTAQTLTGAVNEINAIVTDPGVSVTGSAGATLSSLLDDLFAAADTTKITQSSTVKIESATEVSCLPITGTAPDRSSFSYGRYWVTPTVAYLLTYVMRASSSAVRVCECTAVGNTFSDHSTDNAEGTTMTLIY